MNYEIIKQKEVPFGTSPMKNGITIFYSDNAALL